MRIGVRLRKKCTPVKSIILKYQNVFKGVRIYLLTMFKLEGVLAICWIFDGYLYSPTVEKKLELDLFEYYLFILSTREGYILQN